MLQNVVEAGSSAIETAHPWIDFILQVFRNAVDMFVAELMRETPPKASQENLVPPISIVVQAIQVDGSGKPLPQGYETGRAL